MRLCHACKRPEDDDAGASFTNGYLCKTCGYYRTKPKKASSKQPRRRLSDEDTRDMQTPADPGIQVPRFD